ncbi:hypothetical protein DMA15_22895 [Streptomyces sp. WAC 01529]|uniref:hypothetical protein n=1 Tax=Streptomyces sp. WAC 01529 TaxID=2203205 RepID=UPI000F6DF2E3|nr:hypothetical protein [Streptomyces sp. WAC 01529]AZM55063.1 hypothetical protein DMA15_22895 [Streptomyces sp. WAC 01529]
MGIDQLVPPHPTELWSLREDTLARFGENPRKPVLLRTHTGDIRIARPGATLREALRRMQLGPVLLGNVVPGFPGYDTPVAEWNDASRELMCSLAGLEHVLVRTLGVGATPLLSVVPLTRRARFRPRPPAPGRPARLAPHTVVRRAGSGWLVEPGRRDHLVELHSPWAHRLLADLEGFKGFEGLQGAEAADAGEPLPRPALDAALAYLAAAGILDQGGSSGARIRIRR